MLKTRKDITIDGLIGSYPQHSIMGPGGDKLEFREISGATVQASIVEYHH